MCLYNPTIVYIKIKSFHIKKFPFKQTLKLKGTQIALWRRVLLEN